MVAACTGTDTAETTSTEPAETTTTSLPRSTTTPPTSATTNTEQSLAKPNSNLAVGEATTTEPPRVWGELDRVNILLLGSDAGVGRTGTRTDTVILLSVDTDSGDAAMFSIPRNLTEVPLPEEMGVWGCNCFPDIITHLWANAEWYPEAFPGPQEPPVNALKASLGLVFGLDVHHYAKVDLAGFAAMIDAIGGVRITVPKQIVDETYPHEEGGTERIVIEAGEQLLDGHLALAYSRIRRHSGDFARMHRQRCLIAAMIEQTDASDLLEGADALAVAVAEHVETDIPLGGLADFAHLFSKMSLDRLATLRITSYNYGSAGHAGYQIYDLEQIRADAQALMEDPTVTLETQDGAGWDDICSQSFD
jgi:LCP family protein required for cell wall assembly